MTVIGEMPGGFKLVTETVAGPGSYATGNPPTITFLDLSQSIEAVIAVFGDDGRHMQFDSFTGRVLTFRVRAEDAAPTNSQEFREVTDATDLSGNNYRAVAFGR